MFAVAGHDFHRAIGNRGQERRAQEVAGQPGNVDVKLASSSNLFQNSGHFNIIRKSRVVGGDIIKHKGTKAQRKAAKKSFDAAFLCAFVPLCLIMSPPTTPFLVLKA
ncbi:MAG TPA: hypothetical protein VE422_25615 [Terriglobia bacterium]|nr:hypothetical protein [Terriglobia bacterium]